MTPFRKSSFTNEVTDSVTDLQWWKSKSSHHSNFINEMNMKHLEILLKNVAASAEELIRYIKGYETGDRPLT